MARGRILVADDNRDIRRLVAVSLVHARYTVTEAANGEDALRIATADPPDLIVLDIMLPRLTGWQVLRALKEREDTRSIPVVLMTGVSLRDCDDRASLEGVADYLAKPFNPQRLLDIIENLLHGQPARDARLLDTTRPRPGHEPEEVEFHVPEPERTRLLLLGGDTSDLLKMVLGNPAFEVVLVVEAPPGAGHSLARQLHVPTATRLPETSPGRIDLILDCSAQPGEQTLAWAQAHAADVLGGRSLRFAQALLQARAQSHIKERDLVRELNERIAELSVLRDVALILAAPFDPHQLRSKILELLLRVTRGCAATILAYDERQECFAPTSCTQTSESFAERARVPLSDPLLDELLTLQRPITIPDLQERYPSVLMKSGAREGWRAMQCLPMVVKDKTVGIVVVGLREPQAPAASQSALLGTLTSQLGVALDNCRLYDSTREKQALIEQLLGKVIMAQEDERKHLAAEIHDTVAQSLAGMSSRIQIAQSLVKGGDLARADEMMGDLRALISDSVKEVRQIIFNLRPSSLDDLGLLASLENYSKRFERDTGIGVTLALGSLAQRLPTVLETALFRIVQETLTNTRKHAQARRVWIRLQVERHQLHLKIADDGRGFRWQDVSDKLTSGDSHGVAGMRERAALLGGTYSIESKEGKGSVTTVSLPLPRHTALGGTPHVTNPASQPVPSA